MSHAAPFNPYVDAPRFRHREIASICRNTGLHADAISFSPNLQRFLRVNSTFYRVYVDPVDRLWYLGNKDGRIWCGGLFLRALCVGSKAHTFSYGTAITDRFEDRTDQFWKCAAYFGRRMFNKWYWTRDTETNTDAHEH